MLTKIGAIFDCINIVLASFAGIIIISTMLGITFDVTNRFLFNESQTGLIELTEYGLLYITFLGAAWVLKLEGHVSLDFVLARLKPRSRALANFITSIIGLALCLIVAWYGVKVTWDHFHVAVFESVVLGIPDAYVLIAIPIGSLFLSIQFLKRALGYLTLWKASESAKKV